MNQDYTSHILLNFLFNLTSLPQPDVFLLPIHCLHLHLFKRANASDIVAAFRTSCTQMGPINSLMSCLGVRCQKERHSSSNALNLSTLARLPPELIIHVSSFLSPIEAAAFSLCCTRVYSVLATKYIKPGRCLENFDTFEFLTILQRDLPDHVPCYPCERLHDIKQVENQGKSYDWSSLRSRMSWCRNEDIQVSTEIYIHSGFSFLIFQMAMKRHYQGLDSTSLLALLSHKTDVRPEWCGIKTVTASPRIIGGSLLVRKHWAYLVRRPQDLPTLISSNFVICPHFSYGSIAEVPGYTGSAFRCRVVSSRGNDNIEVGEGLVQCSFCATEVRIDFKSFGEEGNAIFITRWQSLGDGRSSQDPQWLSHVRGSGGTTTERVYFPAGSICSAFEGGEEFDFTSVLTAEERKELLKKARSC